MVDPVIQQLSPHLFWDTHAGELDADKNKNYIIKRVIEYGLWNDWLLIEKFYGVKTISEAAVSFRELDPKALAFIAQISGLPKEKFRCYTTKQSIPPHWNF